MDIFSYIIEREKNGDSKFKETYLNTLKISNKKKLMSIVDYIINIKLFKDRKTKILFLGNKFEDIILGCRNNYKPFVFGSNGIKGRLKLKKNGIRYYNDSIIKNELYVAYNETNSEKRKILVDNLVEKCVKILKKENIECVILINDSLFEERLLCSAAKQLKIPTVTIQHGLFQFENPFINDGFFCEYFFCWGEYFKNKYIEFKIKEEDKIKVIGYPYNSIKNNEVTKRKSIDEKINVCFLGQPYELYNNIQADEKYRIVEKLIKICDEVGANFLYRLHPGEVKEDIIKRCPKIKNISCENDLLVDLVENDIIFGINSTALVEASIANKVSVEIIDEKFISYNYGSKGICYTLNNSYEEFSKFIGDYIKGKIVPLGNNEEYVAVNDSLNNKFEELIDEVLKK